MVFNLHRWFALRRDSVRVAFECDERRRGPLESMTGKLVDFRLAAHARPRASATGFVAKVIQSRGKPFLKLPTVDEEPGRPDGPVLVRLPNGREWEFRFVKTACNVAGPRGSNAGDTLPNELPALLREWFGPDAGLPGTSFEEEFHREGDAWHIARLSAGKPVARARETGSASSHRRPAPTQDNQHNRFLASLPPSLPPRARHTTHVPVYDLTAAAGFWGPESVPEEIGWTEVPGVAVRTGMFVPRVMGTSMELFHAHYLPHTLRAAHGSWFGFCRAEGDLDGSEQGAACDSGERELSCSAGTRCNTRRTTVMTEVDGGKPLQSQVRKLAALHGAHPSCGIVVRAANLRVSVRAVGHF